MTLLGGMKQREVITVLIQLKKTQKQTVKMQDNANSKYVKKLFAHFTCLNVIHFKFCRMVETVF